MKFFRNVFMGAVFATAAFMVVATTQPAKAASELFGLPGWTAPHILTFELVNFGVTQTALLVCRGRLTETPKEFVFAWIPVVGPYEAVKTCFRPVDRPPIRRARR